MATKWDLRSAYIGTPDYYRLIELGYEPFQVEPSTGSQKVWLKKKLK